MKENTFVGTKIKATERQLQTSTPIKSPVHPVLQLQADIGNQRTNDRIEQQSRQNTGDRRFIQTLPMFGGLSGELSQRNPIQAKLSIGTVGDKYEQEADRIAAEVTSQLNKPSGEIAPESHSSDRPKAATLVQKKTTPSPIQRTEANAYDPELETSIKQAKGRGESLPKPLQTKMEQAFGGADFSAVKIHTGTEGDRLNRSLNARAFTTGQDIFFRQQEYNPRSDRGQELLAHELTHVLQQNGGQAQHQLRPGTTPVSPSQSKQANDRLTVQRALATEKHPSNKARDRRFYKLPDPRLLDETNQRLNQLLYKARFDFDPKVASEAIGKRFPKGPLLNTNEFQVIKEVSKLPEGKQWLKDASIFDLSQAENYLKKHDYHNWLKLAPANRVLLAYLAWHRPEETNISKAEVIGTPAYRLGRSMEAKNDNLDRKLRDEYTEEIDRDLREEWIKTLKGKELNKTARLAIEDFDMVRNQGKKKGSSLSISQVEKQHVRATDILKKVLIILHAGLQVYDKQQRQHVDYQGSVIRALSHGGRVNIRIPSLKNDRENPYELTEWLGITENKKAEQSGAVFKRPFGTHHMEIGKNINGQPGTGTFREEGSSKAALKNIGNTELYGMNLAAGGIGARDFNGDAILPDGAHGHMFIGFKPPTTKRDGALEIGIETTAPGGASTVGYHHGPKSSEATANPESSFGGLKADKVGDGSPAKAALIKSKKDEEPETNARLVDLNAVNNGQWLEYLTFLQEAFNKIAVNNLEKYYSSLVGERKKSYE